MNFASSETDILSGRLAESESKLAFRRFCATSAMPTRRKGVLTLKAFSAAPEPRPPQPTNTALSESSFDWPNTWGSAMPESTDRPAVARVVVLRKSRREDAVTKGSEEAFMEEG